MKENSARTPIPTQLQSHTEKCVFIGYPTQYKAWLFWNPVTKREILSNTAQFDERYFPGTSSKPIAWPLPVVHTGSSQEPLNPVGDSMLDLIQLPPSHFQGPADPAGSEDNGKSQKEPDSPTPAPSPAPERPRTPPASPDDPVTPAQSPQQQTVPGTPVRRKRVLTSPASDIQSPEHQRRNVDTSSSPERPQQPLQPMGNFRHSTQAPTERFQTFGSLSHLLQ